MYQAGKQKKPDISVIVPVYNTSAYLHRCLDSVVNQSFENYEIVIVNDGSTDDSEAICREYSEKHSNIILITKVNGGLSEARNTGVRNAAGKYVSFVDSDDYIDERYLETLYRPIVNYEADMSVVGLSLFSDSVPAAADRIGDCVVLSHRDALLDMLYQNRLDTSACALLIPISMALEYPFPPGRFHEDEFTTYKYYSACKKVAVYSEKLYFYYQREGSIMHSMGRAKYDELEAADNLVSVFSEDAELKRAAESMCFSDYCQVFLSSPNIKSEDRQTYDRIMEYLKRVRFQILFDKNTRRKNKLAAASLMAGPAGLRAAAWFKDR